MNKREKLVDRSWQLYQDVGDVMATTTDNEAGVLLDRLFDVCEELEVFLMGDDE